MKVTPFILGLLCLTGLAPTVAFAQRSEAAARIEVLGAKFEFHLSEADKPLAELEAKYIAALDELAKKRQAAGNRDGVLAIKAEKQRIESGAEVSKTAAQDEEIAHFRATFEREYTRIKGSLRDAEIAVYENHAGQLRELMAQRSKQGDAAGELAVHKEIERVRAAIAHLEDPETGKPLETAKRMNKDVLWSLIDGGAYETETNLTAEKSAAGFVLTMAGSKGTKFLTTRESFTPPYRIRARAGTDSTNIRLKFGPKGLVIFNWEVNQEALRIHHYDNGKKIGVPGEGKLQVNRIHTIEVDVTASGILVRANGKEVGEFKSPSTSGEAPIGIGPAFGSMVTVEELVVVRLGDQ